MSQPSTSSDALSVIKKIKKALGVKTDVELAKNLEISNKTISSWKKRNKVPMDIIAIVSKSSFKSIEYFINGNVSCISEIKKLSLDKDVIDIISEDIFRYVLSEYNEEESVFISDEDIRWQVDYIGSYIRLTYETLLTSKKKLVDDSGVSLDDFREAHRLSQDARAKAEILSGRIHRKK